MNERKKTMDGSEGKEVFFSFVLYPTYKVNWVCPILPHPNGFKTEKKNSLRQFALAIHVFLLCHPYLQVGGYMIATFTHWFSHVAHSSLRLDSLLVHHVKHSDFSVQYLPLYLYTHGNVMD